MKPSARKLDAPPVLPDWLSAVPDSIKPEKPIANRYLLAEVNHLVYEALFESTLDKLSVGQSIGSIMREAQRGPETAQFIRWMLKDPQRKARYDEALTYGAEVMKSQLIDIADGVNENGSEIPEDIQRAKLRIDTRLKIMAFDNRKKFGETKTVEINQTISITDALAQANRRIGDIMDGEIIDVPQLENDDVE